MNYATQVGNPTAHITKKKSRLKVYNDKIVFLNHKDNFEFELHNPKQKSVLCKIKLNGEYISNNGVIIKPGQRVFLERFLDSNNKFEFSTYMIDPTTPNWSAIQLNGDVLIEFYDEQQIINNATLSGNWGNPWTTTTTTGSPYLGGMTFTTNGSSNNQIIGTITSTNAFYTSKYDTTPEKPIRNIKSKKSIETGRVEKGEISNQSFINSYETFSPYTSHKIEFKIYSLSNKNKNVEEIRQYCTECGTKVKKNYKFCPSCGNKI
jgi:hypothetical protein